MSVSGVVLSLSREKEQEAAWRVAETRGRLSERSQGGACPCLRRFCGDGASHCRLAIKRLDKGIWWMPWRQEAMKDVARCEKPGGDASDR